MDAMIMIIALAMGSPMVDAIPDHPTKEQIERAIRQKSAADAWGIAMTDWAYFEGRVRAKRLGF